MEIDDDYCNSNSSEFAYRLLSQSVQISDLNIEQSTFRVSTQLSLLALRSDLVTIALSIGPDCVLPDQPGFSGAGRVAVNDVDARYSRAEPDLKLSAENEQNDGKSNKSVTALADAWAQSEGGDLLLIRVPDECLELVQQEHRVLLVHVDLMVVRPREGVKFVFARGAVDQPDEQNGEEKDPDAGAHVFTYRSNPLGSTRHWLPCAAEPSQLCVWRFELTVPSRFSAVCCGDLVDTIPCLALGDDSAEDPTIEESTAPFKTYCYQLLVPTSAMNIGFAIGDFQMCVQPEMPEIISFVPPELISLLKNTMLPLNRTFEFFEELLSCRFPYSTYWQVFVDQTPDEVTSFAGLSILSLRLLYHKKILDIAQRTRQHLARAIAQQFFGAFIAPRAFEELWLLRALSGYLTGIFVERFFGTTEHIYQLNKLLKDACDYESRFGAVALRRLNHNRIQTHHRMPKQDQQQLYFDPSRPETCSPLYLDALFNKGQFVVRMLERRLPKDQFIKVLQHILSQAMQHSQCLERPAEWSHLLLCCASFLRQIADVTGKEMPSFVDQWIDTPGFVSFQVSHTFNRKRNIIELELRQTVPPPKGCQNYTGPLSIVVQELEGHFVHQIQIDAAVSRHDIQCHSKGRKLKKKRIVLGTGEEVDMDLAQMDADSPVLWIRIDPELLLYRQLQISQPFYQWEFLLLHERDVLAQQQAIEALYRFPGHQTRTILEEAVRNEKFYYRIRRDAAQCLVHVYNSLPDSQLGESPPLMDYFRLQFGSRTAPDVPQSNNYAATSTSLQSCLLLQALPSAIGAIRWQGGKECPRYVLDFLLGLIRLNDNSANRYADDGYRGALIHALSKTLTLAERPIEQPAALSPHAQTVLEEVTHALNMDTMRPSFGRVVSQHCVQVLYELQRCRHLPIDTDIFWKFGQCKGVYAPLRMTALACLVAMLRRSRNQQFIGTILRLITLVQTDPDPFVRYSLAHRLCTNPPFEWTEKTPMYPLNTQRLADQLWAIIADPHTETRVRTTLTDLFYILYGPGPAGNFSSF